MTWHDLSSYCFVLVLSVYLSLEAGYNIALVCLKSLKTSIFNSFFFFSFVGKV